jgi:hypothetical protein
MLASRLQAAGSSGHVSPGARRVVVVLATASVVLGLTVTQATAAGQAGFRPLVSTRAPAAMSGQLLGVTSVPHSSDLWTFGATGGDGTKFQYFIGRRHAGRWKRLKAPGVGGSYGQINVIDAGSSGTVWLGGNREAAGIQDGPSIWRWNGRKFVAEKLPKMQTGEATPTYISASSATNAWATGGLYLPNNDIIALHWNGHKWDSVATPNNAGLGPVATSGPTSAFAISAGMFEHWNGKVWSVDGTQPAGVQLNAIATSSAKLAYAVGFNSTTDKPVIMRFNGTNWSAAALSKNVTGTDQLENVTMHGRTAWAIGIHGAHHVILGTTGGAWKTQQTLKAGVTLEAISAQSSKRAYTAGLYDSLTKGNTTYAEAYNGHSWKTIATKI